MHKPGGGASYSLAALSWSRQRNCSAEKSGKPGPEKEVLPTDQWLNCNPLAPHLQLKSRRYKGGVAVLGDQRTRTQRGASRGLLLTPYRETGP